MKKKKKNIGFQFTYGGRGLQTSATETYIYVWLLDHTFAGQSIEREIRQVGDVAFLAQCQCANDAGILGNNRLGQQLSDLRFAP